VEFILFWVIAGEEKAPERALIFTLFKSGKCLYNEMIANSGLFEEERRQSKSIVRCTTDRMIFNTILLEEKHET
jgi:hypothetical protein